MAIAAILGLFLLPLAFAGRLLPRDEVHIRGILPSSVGHLRARRMIDVIHRHPPPRMGGQASTPPIHH
ncbi:hypothetical protein CDL15_Pgr004186 [Punica granatum]|uniref:Uncharacterized protein n=1 Tax=Punica granatum TaxID=22663 RepID=A0A218XGA7_PUNGR|nr:hypothetical protein CDL15_Pgr004186 [Punica granatum]